MSLSFQVNDPSLESQWRAIILFGKNSATYKFAFAKALLEVVESQKDTVRISELAKPYADSIVEHLKKFDKQGNSQSSKFLNACRSFIRGEIDETELYGLTERHGFDVVVDAFQNINGALVPNPFYEKNFQRANKEIVITDNLLKIKELFQYRNLGQEVEARWNLVETAWNLNINPNLLEVSFDEENSLFFVESDLMRRVDITSVRDALNGYQKGKCFYTFQDISINFFDGNVCDVDHFLPHVNKMEHGKYKANINGVWNLVLTDSSINRMKGAKIPEIKYLERLFNRNEFYIESKHPLAETIINQTGRTKDERRNFLKFHYELALSNSIQRWEPDFELEPLF